MKIIEVPQRQGFAVPIWRSLMVIALAGLTVTACLWTVPPPSKSETGVEMTLPVSIDSFVGSDQEISQSERVILPPDTEFAKKLYTDGRDTINCQIVLAGGEKRSIHRPEICLPAQGWTLQTGEVVPIKLANGASLDVMKLIISKRIALAGGQQRELNSVFIYWFIGRDTTTPHHLVRILRTNLDMLLHNTSHRWAYVIVSAPILEGFVPKGRNTEETLKLLKAFIAALAPQIIKPRALLLPERP